MFLQPEKSNKKSNPKKTKLKKFYPKIFSLILLVTTIAVFSIANKNKEKLKNNTDINQLAETSSQNVKNTDIGNLHGQEKELKKELRAVWIPFMDLQVQDFNEENFKKHYKDILDKVEKINLNTVFVQVRPFSDAFYPSKLFPWSHILTGKQGKNPGFDPLAFMIEETHSRNIQFHAWIVPMRIKNTHFPQDLSEMNPCVKWEKEEPEKFKKYVVKTQEYEYYDPQYEEVRKLIADGVKEIVEAYNVDGVNFDDYFYPANNLWVDGKFTGSMEKITQEKKDEENQIRKKRSESINLLISEVYSLIKSIKSEVLFGVCPQGNFDNLEKAGVDVMTWTKNQGYVDYLCPEIYTNSENPVLPFEKAASDWRKLCSDKKISLYAGLGLYKTGTNEYDKGSWLKSDDIIKNQIEHLRRENYDGFALYSSVYLDRRENQIEVQNIMKILS